MESALLDLPGVSGAAAVVRNGMVLVGYLLLDDPSVKFDVSAARQALARRLPHGLLPTLAVLSSFPLSPSGKVNRKALPWPLPRVSGEPGIEAVTSENDGDLAWIAEHWRALLGVEPTAKSNFFSLGGTSLAVAQLVSMLRERFPQASVTDIYNYPILAALVERLSSFGKSEKPDKAEVSVVPVRPLSRFAAFTQSLLSLAMLWYIGARWTIGVLLSTAMFGVINGGTTASTAHWISAGLGFLLLVSTPGRTLVAGVGARMLTAGIREGEYGKGSWNHLRLWAAEKFVTVVGVTSLPGTPWNLTYARLLGNKIGRDVDLHTLPPVTGLGSFGDRCTIEPEADLSGWWLDGNVLRVGTVDVGEHAAVGSRATLMPGSVVQASARVATGASVHGVVPAGESWSGSPARPFRLTDRPWPIRTAVRTWGWRLAYSLTPALSGAIMVMAMLPVVFMFSWSGQSGTSNLVLRMSWTIPLSAVLYLLLNTLLTAVLIRLTGRGLRIGDRPLHSKAGWSAWLIQRTMTSVRESAFPIYASMLTTVWLRLLGAKIGPRTEASTVVGIPQLMSVGTGAFLADDSKMAPYQLRNGWVRTGRATVGDRAFVGNSAEIAADRTVHSGSLIGVWSEAPAQSVAGSSWLGRPGIELPRQVGHVDQQRTFEPRRGLVLARAVVESTRIVPLVIGAALSYGMFTVLSQLIGTMGLLLTVLLSGGVLLTAGLIGTVLAVAAKWLLLGRVRQATHPLWSSFVWRNELTAVYYEELVVRWLGLATIGSPLFNAVLRAFGARIGRGVCCETRWLPEPDLIVLGDGAVINRGCVVQTHLFQDRILRLGTVHVESGATLGPHSIALFDSTLGERSSVGANSLVMRGETVHADGRFAGNPITPQLAD